MAINCDKNTIEIFRFLLRNIQVLIGVNWLVGILEPNPILLPNSIGGSNLQSDTSDSYNQLISKVFWVLKRPNWRHE